MRSEAWIFDGTEVLATGDLGPLPRGWRVVSGVYAEGCVDITDGHRKYSRAILAVLYFFLPS